MDKRRYLRFQLPGRAQITFDGWPAQQLAARTRDFSRQGLSLETDLNGVPAQAKRLRVDIAPAWNPGETISLDGRVTWQKRSNDCCHLGIAIDRMDAAAKSDLLGQSYWFWQTVSQARECPLPK